MSPAFASGTPTWRSSSRAFLQIPACWAEGRVDYYVRTTHTYEWDTAAGELILAEAGGSTRTLPDGRELLYNEEDLRNPWFVCRSKFSKI